jgi:hypothetical protein
MFFMVGFLIGAFLAVMGAFIPKTNLLGSATTTSPPATAPSPRIIQRSSSLRLRRAAGARARRGY